MQTSVPGRASGQELYAVEGWHGGEDDARVGEDGRVHKPGLAAQAADNKLLGLEDPLGRLNLLGCLAGVFL